MTIETDMSREEAWFKEKLARRCLTAMEKHNIPGHYCPDRDEALQKILEMIPPGVTIGAGDSVTLSQIGILDELEKRGSHQVFDPFRKDGEDCMPDTFRDLIETGKQALATDYFLTGLNAITVDGKIVNTDRTGNRASGLIFGPKKVIAVAGINKIVANLEEALARVKEVAAPLNAYRHHIKHEMDTPPCAITGTCADCRHPRRICCYTVIVEYQITPRIELVIVGEDLGI
ncbi:MAG: lactate utilization protein [Dehalococcoidales bacterium]|nr:lactate utilization protein [Dehalococcoidales bacterium]